MATIRAALCISLLFLLHVPGAMARADDANPRSARIGLGDPAGASPAAAPHGRVVVASPDDPRVRRALVAMEFARTRSAPLKPAGRESVRAMMRDEVIDPSGGGGDGRSSPDALGWAPFIGAWNLRHAAHLMKRARIGPRFEEIVAARDAGPAAAVASLLVPQAPPVPPGSWINEPPPDWGNMTPEELDQLVENYLERQYTIILWWVEQIVHHQTSLTEPMTLFWHDHFATAAETVFFPQAIYGQHALLRQHALGNFRDLTRALGTDPAMLIWLNGDGNTVEAPNENFARELFELFTMGEGSGYTQTDVEEAARACTGYVTDGVSTYFVPQWHDGGPKTILGQTGEWGMDELIDLLFEQPATANHLSRKLYTWFVDDEPSEADVEELAVVLRANDYEVAPVLATLFASHQFYMGEFRGSIVKAPVDLYAGQVRALHAVDFNPIASPDDYERFWLFWQMWDLGQMLTNPPNVAGWPGHRNWINTATLPLRKEYSTMILDGDMWGGALGFQVDVMPEAGRFTDPDDPYALVDDAALLLLGAPPSDLVRDSMLDALLQGSPPYSWSTGIPQAPARIRDLLRFTMRLPDYQLR